MKNIKELVFTLYRHRFVRYLLVGGSTVIIDFCLLVLLHGLYNVQLAIATSISYWISIVYNFLLNRWWTFSASENSNLRKHMFSYGLLLGFNYTFTVIFVSVISHNINYALAKIVAVLIQVTWTYFVYKYVIFTHPTERVQE